MDHIQPMELSDVQEALDEVSPHPDDRYDENESEALIISESDLHAPRYLCVPIGFHRLLDRLPVLSIEEAQFAGVDTFLEWVNGCKSAKELHEAFSQATQRFKIIYDKQKSCVEKLGLAKQNADSGGVITNRVSHDITNGCRCEACDRFERYHQARAVRSEQKISIRIPHEENIAYLLEQIHKNLVKATESMKDAILIEQKLETRVYNVIEEVQTDIEDEDGRTRLLLEGYRITEEYDFVALYAEMDEIETSLKYCGRVINGLLKSEATERTQLSLRLEGWQEDLKPSGLGLEDVVESGDSWDLYWK